MERKSKTIDPSDTFDDSHEYRCLRCGATWENPVNKFYKSPWSESFEKNSRYVSLCIKCVKEMFEIMKENMERIMHVFLCATN